MVILCLFVATLSTSSLMVILCLFVAMIQIITSFSEIPMDYASQENCTRICGDRRYFLNEELRHPPVLYTFPGSGNTWFRLLLEKATGIYTGSIYNDPFLINFLPGEYTCNSSVSLIKAHPHISFSSLYHGPFHSHHDKCRLSNTTNFKRAMLIIRNPYDAIWSEYQREFAHGVHFRGISRDDFNREKWNKTAIYLANQYKNMLTDHYPFALRRLRKGDLFFMKFEDLQNRNLSSKILLDAIKFLHLNTTEKKVECAFILSDNRYIHRKVNSTHSISKEEAYTPELACEMWAHFGKFVKKYGYGTFKGYDCTTLGKFAQNNTFIPPS